MIFAAAEDFTSSALEQNHPGRQLISQITNLTPIPLQLGPNHIARFAPDGRDGTITLAWHDEGGGQGYDVFLVTMPNRRGGEWRTVGLSKGDGSPQNAIITDDPGQGDNVIHAIRFARGMINGQHATLLLSAVRVEDGNVRPSSTTYEVYRLVQNADRDVFERITSQSLSAPYCNADMALTIASGLPLRSSYRGPRDVNGGFTRDGCRDPQVAVRRSHGDNGQDSSRVAQSRNLSKEQREKLFEEFLSWRTPGGQLR
jgi:hypothetical protein